MEIILATHRPDLPIRKKSRERKWTRNGLDHRRIVIRYTV